jgi:hypothetical protein
MTGIAASAAMKLRTSMKNATRSRCPAVFRVTAPELSCDCRIVLDDKTQVVIHAPARTVTYEMASTAGVLRRRSASGFGVAVAGCVITKVG